MKSTTKDLLIDVIQSYAIGKVNSDFSPQALAAAILKKVDFNKPISEISASRNRDILRTFRQGISDFKNSMDSELKKLNKEEKLFANFLRGKITAYQEVKNLIK